MYNILFNDKCTIYEKGGTNGAGVVVKGELVATDISCRIETKTDYNYSKNDKTSSIKTIIYIPMDIISIDNLKIDYFIEMDENSYNVKSIKKNTSAYSQFNHFEVEVI